jgi:hypothetical protein
MVFSVRMAVMMSRALAFSPLAMAETDGALSESGSVGCCRALVSGSWDLSLSVGGSVSVAGGSGLSSGGGNLTGGVSVRESNSVGCCRDAFSRATWDGG